ncbi:MAG TPA: D-TA family PLP-dependent enzyme [Planctomycetota bacterium]|nr:D-TA family PLP-dependent enzyme [Planctomycetota bacterium]
MSNAWYSIENAAEIDTPALLFYVERIEENLRRTVQIAGGTARLRPHIKTHKCAEVLRMQMNAGIEKFKCATIAEAELAGQCGVADIMMAYQPTGPKVERFAKLVERYGLTTRFSCIVDDESAIRALDAEARKLLKLIGPFDVFLDVDTGQGRTGVVPGTRAVELYRLMASLPGLKVRGLHSYDGHVKDTDFSARKISCDAAFARIDGLRRDLIDAGLSVPTIVMGGSPTFPFHAARENVECSPGTTVFWDAGMVKNFPDLDFLPAALVMTRVVSKPGGNRLCLDLGHKAVAAEMPQPRVIFPELTQCNCVMQNEEHLVIEVENADGFAVGDVLYGIPWHVCPTVNLYGEARVVREGRAGEAWEIAGRVRRIEI